MPRWYVPAYYFPREGDVSNSSNRHPVSSITYGAHYTTSKSVSIPPFHSPQAIVTRTKWPGQSVTKGALPHVYHFDGKAKVEEHIRSTPLPASFMIPGFYMSNIPGANLRPSPIDNAWTLAMPVPATAPVPLFAAREDTGKFVKAILLHREETLGKRVLAATKYYTLQDVLDAFKSAYPEAGKTAKYFELPKDTFKGFLTGKGLPEFAAQELLENMLLLNEGGYYGGDNLEWSQSVSYTLHDINLVESALTLQYSSCGKS